jgi:two-component system chemotaxis sensor kinase CheA
MNTSEAEFYRKLRSTFCIEAHEHMRNISLSILDLETVVDKQQRKRILETIHREFHSLKGAARAVDLTEIETICHMLEGIFADIKKEILVISGEMFDVFNGALDIIEKILSVDIDESFDISELMEELTKIKKHNIGENGASVLKEATIDYKEIVKEEVELDREIGSVLEKTLAKKPEEKTEFNNKTSSENIQFKSSFHQDNGMEYMRVSKNKLDSLLLQGEEMLYSKLSIKQRESEIRELKTFLETWKQEKNYGNFDGLDKKIDSLLISTMNDGQVVETMLNRFMDDVKDLMLMPFSSIIEMFPKMVRDISRKLNKDIEFTYSGVEFEIDRRILEELKDPLIHIIRNSVDHGIESTEERKRLDKNPKGSVSLNISQIGSGYVQIQIIDDGSGLDVEKLKDTALQHNFISKGEVDILNYYDAQMLIFKSGISTKEIITDLSGRGLGLAIVREKIEKLDGTINVTSEKNKGTVFEILLPITISTNRGIIIRVSKQDFVVPTSKVEKVIKVSKAEIKVIESRATIIVDGHIIPIFRLQDILQLQISKEHEEDKFISLLIVNDLEKKMAFSVDEIIVEQEVLVKQFNKQLAKVRNISGATILGTGEVVPILEVQDLIKYSLSSGNNTLKLNNKVEETSKKSIIVVEDSITSRTLLKNVLENNGYKVKTAVDGLEGWKAIKAEKFDLIISDVEMPRMNGFELTSVVRSHEETAEIPVILVTSLDSKEDTERGIEVGASAYIIKSNFQQNNLLEVIKKLI